MNQTAPQRTKPEKRTAAVYYRLRLTDAQAQLLIETIAYAARLADRRIVKKVCPQEDHDKAAALHDLDDHVARTLYPEHLLENDEHVDSGPLP